MSIVYNYIKDNNLLEPQFYNYSKFEGIDFLKEYLKVRISFINKYFSERDYECDFNLEIDNSGHYTIEPIFLELLIKTFEVNKRIYSKYTVIQKLSKVLLKPDKKSDFNDLNNYLKFSQCLISKLKKDSNYFYLNCLLKLNDILLSLSKFYLDKPKDLAMIASSLKWELSFLSILLNQDIRDFIQCHKNFPEKRNENLCSLDNHESKTKNLIKLNDFLMIYANTKRSQIYLNSLIENGYIPSSIIFLGKEKDYNLKFNKLRDLSVNYNFSDVDSINTPEFKELFTEIKQPYIIYSGKAGEIVDADLLAQKKFVHIHAGLLPNFKGSTTCYYSLLDDLTISATAIFLNEHIDSGDVICSLTLNKESILALNSTDVDNTIEPYIRSQVLIKVIELYQNKGLLKAKEQISKNNKSYEYYRIHPVLKHIALFNLFD